MSADVRHRLFSYGTLRLASVQQARFGRLLSGEADAIVGWRLESVAITDPDVLAQSGEAVHPIMVPGDAGDRVAGTVLMLTDAELAAADAYEVADYHRVEVPLASGGRAWAYVSAAYGSADALPSPGTAASSP